MIRNSFGALLFRAAGASLALGVWAGAPAAELPMRWTTGAAVWSTPQDAIDTFLNTGAITDRGLEGGLQSTPWGPEEIRAAMNKLYSVELAAVDRFLDSPAGGALLQGQSGRYGPYWGQGRSAVEALRAAILAAAAEGQISSATILARLPTNMRVAPGCRAPSGGCEPLLTWWVFLPARIQAGAFSGAGRGRSAIGAPAAAAPAAPGAP